MCHINIINHIILNFSQKNIWKWYTICNHYHQKLKFKEYISLTRKILFTKKKYLQIYNWLIRRLFINKSIKLVEYFYRPLNEGYYLSLNNFNKYKNY